MDARDRRVSVRAPCGMDCAATALDVVPRVPSRAAREGRVVTRHAYKGTDGRRCLGVLPDATAEAKAELAAHQLGGVDCARCLRILIEGHIAMADVLSDQLERVLGGKP